MLWSEYDSYDPFYYVAAVLWDNSLFSSWKLPLNHGNVWLRRRQFVNFLRSAIEARRRSFTVDFKQKEAVTIEFGSRKTILWYWSPIHIYFTFQFRITVSKNASEEHCLRSVLTAHYHTGNPARGIPMGAWLNFCALLSLNKAKIKLNQVINCNSNARNGFKGVIFIKTKHLKRTTICYKTVINNWSEVS